MERTIQKHKKENTKINKERNSSLEILRIISMLLIVLHHFSVHGIQKYSNITISGKYINDILFLGGKIGVNIFILISAYFMVDKTFSIKKFLKIERAIVILFNRYMGTIYNYKSNNRNSKVRNLLIFSINI